VIDVCIASYKRPELLERLLRALLAQETEGELAYRIVVADNDAERSAEPVVRRLATGPTEIVYGVEPRQSVSLARNKSVSLSSGELVAITDDDLYPDPRWLSTLHRAMAAHDADVVHGPVVPEFRPDTPAHIRECPLFNRPNPPTGSTEGYVFTTANTLFRRELIAGVEAPFDPRFGRTGGEDTKFFSDLRRRGARMIWCREARVHGPVPAARASLRWIARRRFRYGNMMPVNGGPPMKPADLRSAGRDVLRSALAAPVYLASGIVDRRRREEGMKALTTVLMHAAFLLGMVARYARFEYEEYRPR
jgi:succinoglycan biosynthesis protein ExoM